MMCDESRTARGEAAGVLAKPQLGTEDDIRCTPILLVRPVAAKRSVTATALVPPRFLGLCCAFFVCLFLQ